MKEHLEEVATRNLRPLVDKLFGEMTVLGFLSVVTFAVTKAGWFSALSEIFFGDEEELLEIFEFVHFTIFFIVRICDNNVNSMWLCERTIMPPSHDIS